MIAIIDYNAGNTRSVMNALDYLGVEYELTSNPDKIATASAIILPGVGSFGYAMENLRKKCLEQPINDALRKGTPFFGICLGLQLLFEESEESPGVKGLGIFKGRVARFRKGKVPHVGWNCIIPTGEVDIFNKGFAYFVNSFFVVPEDKRIIAAESDYYGTFACAVKYKNITAVQFHPEKSGKFGIEILRRWLKCWQKE
ncbi:imidazole glycerol phosphate synthase subunit HisH [candidate division KSB1 bacterium]